MADPVRNLAAFAHEAELRFRSTDDAAVIAGMPLSNRLDAMAYSSDGSLLAATDDQAVLRLWSLADPTAPRQVAEERLDAGRTRSLAFLGGSHHLAVLSSNAQLSLLDVSHAENITSLATAHPGGESASLVLPSRDGRRLIACHDQLTVWDTSQDGLRLAGQLDLGSCSTMAMSPDGYLLAVATGELVTLYDIADPNQPRRLAPLAGQNLSAGPLAFSTDRTSLAIGAGDGSIRVWNITDPLRPTLTDQLSGLGGGISALTFAGNSGALIAQIQSEVRGGGETFGWLRIWVLGGLFTYGSQVAFSPRQRIIAAGLPPRLWDLSDRRLPAGQPVIGGYRFGGQGMAISDDGSKLALGTPPVLYDISSPQHPRRLTQSPPAEEEPTVVTFLPGNLALLTLTSTGLVLWDVSNPASPRRLSTVKINSFVMQGLAVSLMAIDSARTAVRSPRRPAATFGCGTLIFVASWPSFVLARLTSPNRSGRPICRNGPTIHHADDDHAPALIAGRKPALLLIMLITAVATACGVPSPSPPITRDQHHILWS